MSGFAEDDRVKNVFIRFADRPPNHRVFSNHVQTVSFPDQHEAACNTCATIVSAEPRESLILAVWDALDHTYAKHNGE